MLVDKEQGLIRESHQETREWRWVSAPPYLPSEPVYPTKQKWFQICTILPTFTRCQQNQSKQGNIEHEDVAAQLT